MRPALFVKDSAEGTKAFECTTDNLSTGTLKSVTQCTPDSLINGSIRKGLLHISKAVGVSLKPCKVRAAHRAALHCTGGHACYKVVISKEFSIIIKRERSLIGLLLSPRIWGWYR